MSSAETTATFLVTCVFLVTFNNQLVNCQLRREQIDTVGKYFVSWRVEHESENSTAEPSNYQRKNNSIVFQVDAETRGFVGFGVSPKGGMMSADIVIGGVYPNGTKYFRDAFGVGNREPVFDERSNWKLIEAWENETHTHLEFSRLLDTCDEQDVVIQNDTTYLIWAISETDDLKYHGNMNRGSYAVNLMDPPMPEIDISKFETWKMTDSMEMLNNSTTYWCTIHKSPVLSKKHHIVGFRPVLPTPEAVRHTHHFIVHECVAPTNKKEEDLFESFVTSGSGDHCYEDFNMTQYCRTYLFVWAVGGKMVTFPEHTGFPIGENGRTSYYMLEVHYDNPTKLRGVKFESGVEFFYTKNLRKYDAGLLTLGQFITFALTIPPRASNFEIVGHCSPQCTDKIPSNGIKVFNVLLHSHLAGRKLKLRQFRNNTELPWISNDDNYNFNYQQNRPLMEERTILPGDHLTFECTYETKDKENVTIGGLSTQEEMCVSFLWYYPRISLKECQSSVSHNDILKEFGIQSIKWNGNNNPLVTQPSSLANKTYTEVLDTTIDWTTEKVASFQKFQKYSKQHVVCDYQELEGNNKTRYQIFKDSSITYPEKITDYEETSTCAGRKRSANA